MPKPTAIVYIDGLNLQRRLIDTLLDEIWLNHQLLVENLLQDYRVKLVRLFTARSNVAQPAVQDKYWALIKRQFPSIQVQFGRLKTTIRMYPAHVSGNGQVKRQLVKVRKIEEKGSDVALGSWMVLDASRNAADIYVLLSCDTDFEPVLRLIRTELGAKIGLLVPNSRLPKLYAQLQPVFVRHIDASDILGAKMSLKKMLGLLDEKPQGQTS